MDREQKPCVEVKNVSKTFERGGELTHALRSVNFTAHPGELVMIVGPSGSGKTTLLSAIAGTLRFDDGHINVFDFALEKKHPEKICAFRKKNIGFIFQQFHLIKTLTCSENVSIPLRLQGLPSKKALEEAKLALESVGLKDKINMYPKFLSGGQQQRVAIARALVHNPGLIICDEPTSALDAETGGKVMELIGAHAKNNNRCIIVVTHDSRIFKYADRMVRMDDGQISTIERYTHD